MDAFAATRATCLGCVRLHPVLGSFFRPGMADESEEELSESETLCRAPDMLCQKGCRRTYNGIHIAQHKHIAYRTQDCTSHIQHSYDTYSHNIQHIHISQATWTCAPSSNHTTTSCYQDGGTHTKARIHG